MPLYAFLAIARVSLLRAPIESPIGSKLAISIAKEGPEITPKFLVFIKSMKLANLIKFLKLKKDFIEFWRIFLISSTVIAYVQAINVHNIKSYRR